MDNEEKKKLMNGHHHVFHLLPLCSVKVQPMLWFDVDLIFVDFIKWIKIHVTGLTPVLHCLSLATSLHLPQHTEDGTSVRLHTLLHLKAASPPLDGTTHRQTISHHPPSILYCSEAQPWPSLWCSDIALAGSSPPSPNLYLVYTQHTQYKLCIIPTPASLPSYTCGNIKPKRERY